MGISIIYKSKLRMGVTILRRVLMITYEMLLRSHLSINRIIALLGNSGVIFDDLRDEF